MTASIGVAGITPKMTMDVSHEIQALIERADEALYKTKEMGRNSVTVAE